MAAEEVVRAYKRLSKVERAFRTLKSLDLFIRPIYHRLEERVRGHVLVEWQMRQPLAPLLFEDDDKAASRPAEVGGSPRATLPPSEQESPDQAD